MKSDERTIIVTATIYISIVFFIGCAILKMGSTIKEITEDKDHWRRKPVKGKVR